MEGKSVTYLNCEPPFFKAHRYPVTPICADQRSASSANPTAGALKYKFMSFSACQYLSVYANTCQYMSLSVNICQYMSVYVNTCQYMSIPVSIYQYLSVYVNTCQYMPIHVSICQHLSVNVNIQAPFSRNSFAVFHKPNQILFHLRYASKY